MLRTWKRKEEVFSAVLGGVGVFLLFGCSRAVTSSSTAAPSAVMEEVSFRAFIAPVLTSKCVSCHSGENPPHGILLDSYNEVVKYVVAGNAEESELYEVISGPSPQMPKGQPPLPEQTVRLIRDWINQGAKDN